MRSPFSVWRSSTVVAKRFSPARCARVTRSASAAGPQGVAFFSRCASPVVAIVENVARKGARVRTGFGTNGAPPDRPVPPGALPLDELDPVAVRIAHEAEPRAAFAHAIGRPLGLDSLPGEPLQRPVEVVDRDGDVAVAGAELVRVDAE